MIKTLYIKNFILIDELTLDFQKGFSAFTGETGAGKSIMIDAISLLGHGRAGSSYVMKGRDKAVIEATFDISSDSHAKKVLEEAGLDVNEEITCTREIFAGGKSGARIDRRVVTLSLVQDCLRDQIDIHGQRDNAYLLNPSSHIRLLDRYMKKDDIREKTAGLYRAYDALVKEKQVLLEETYNESDLDYFRYQISEIESAHLTAGEDRELEEKEKQYRSFRNSMEKYHSLFSLYDDELSGPLYELNKRAQALPDEKKVNDLQAVINDAYYAITDAVDELRHLTSAFDMSEEEINEMEERLFLLQKMKRRYGGTIEEILSKKAELEKKVHAWDHRKEVLDELEDRISAAYKAYEKAALTLRGEREKAAVRLDREIAVQMKDLMLENAVFVTDIQDGTPSEKGIDTVEFRVSMNKGESPKPLIKTASGGEISRLMLGLKEVFTRLQGIHTVIFDEIDTGVSGPVATAIGRKMQTLSKDCQVFAVTHLAPVAACADTNYLVYKITDDKSTKTAVRKLNREETIEQLALIASSEITDSSVKAAQELYERNRS
ncbi:MAG: DNA repair protein RecN [Solobacterium sp.]|nr:DNA repair protein RecN [Solobacterium sp.]